MYNRSEEIYEAIYAGEEALQSLKEAQQALSSASSWGLVDIFGGNMISGFMKYSRLKDAENAIDRAKYDVSRFSHELGDIHDLQSMRIDIGGFLTFADFFFDGILADVLVQSKISDARRQVQEAQARINAILDRLVREV